MWASSKTSRASRVDWVKYTLQRLYPRVNKYIEARKIEIISARKQYGESMSSKEWTRYAFGEAVVDFYRSTQVSSQLFSLARSVMIMILQSSFLEMKQICTIFLQVIRNSSRAGTIALLRATLVLSELSAKDWIALLTVKDISLLLHSPEHIGAGK